MIAAKVLSKLADKLGGAHGHPPEVQFFCPFCIDRRGTESSHPKLYVNFTTGKAICFRCGFKAASIERLMSAVYGGNVPADILTALRGKGGGAEVQHSPDRLRGKLLVDFFAPKKSSHPELVPYPLPPEYRPVVDHWREPLFRRAVNYLQERCVVKDTARLYRIGYCTSGEFAQRLIFPVVQDGEVVYFSNRYAGEHPVKSKNPKNITGYYTASTCLMGFDQAMGQERVAVCEGFFDMLAARPAVAMLGKQISRDQLHLFRRLVEGGTRELVVMLDADAEAYEAVRILRRLSGVTISAVTLAHGDPDSRKSEIPALIDTRHELTFVDRVRQKFVRRK